MFTLYYGITTLATYLQSEIIADRNMYKLYHLHIINNFPFRPWGMESWVVSMESSGLAVLGRSWAVSIAFGVGRSWPTILGRSEILLAKRGF